MADRAGSHPPAGRPLWESSASAVRARLLLLCCLVVLVGTTASVAFHYVMGVYLGRHYPYSTFLFRPANRFMDFFNMYRAAQTYGHGGHRTVVYSPFLHAVMKCLTLMPRWPAFITMVVVFAATLVFGLWRFIARAVEGRLLRMLCTVILTALSYGVIMVVDRGNLEALVFVFLFWFIYFYYVRRSRWSWVFLAMAVAAKYFPATLLVLLLSDRRYRQAAYALAGALVLTGVGLVVMKLTSGLTFAEVAHSLKGTLGSHLSYAGTIRVSRYGHTLWGALVVLLANAKGVVPHAAHIKLIYAAAAGALFLGLSAYVVFFEKVAWRKVTILVACFLLLPFESADYTLVYLYLPLLLLFVSDRRSVVDLGGALLFGLLLVPVDYYYFHWRVEPDVSISVLIKPALLMAAVVLIVVGGFSAWRAARRRLRGAAAPPWEEA